MPPPLLADQPAIATSRSRRRRAHSSTATTPAMARARGLFCLVSPVHGEPSDRRRLRRRGSAACICCVGPHHKPSSGAPDADLSARLPLTSCCSGGDVRGRRRGSSAARTPRTPCTPTARRLCGARPRTPRRGQVCCFPAAVASAGPAPAAAAVARTPGTTGTQQRAFCVGAPAQQGPGSRRRRWFRSARQTTPRFRGAGRDTALAGNSNSKSIAVAEVETAAGAEEDACLDDEYALLCRVGFSRDDVAAVTIQAYFRGHLARRALRALKSLVRVQAVARGAFVRRQAEVAIHCMQAMARLQARVRARQRMLPKPEPQGQEEKLLQSSLTSIGNR